MKIFNVILCLMACVLCSCTNTDDDYNTNKVNETPVISEYILPDTDYSISSKEFLSLFSEKSWKLVRLEYILEDGSVLDHVTIDGVDYDLLEIGADGMSLPNFSVTGDSRIKEYIYVDDVPSAWVNGLCYDLGNFTYDECNNLLTIQMNSFKESWLNGKHRILQLNDDELVVSCNVFLSKSIGKDVQYGILKYRCMTEEEQFYFDENYKKKVAN